MKFKYLVFLVICMVLASDVIGQGVKISAVPGSPDASAILEAQSTTQGFLPPRMSTSERDAIVNPAVGLVIFNTESNCLDAWLGSYWGSTCFNCMPAPSVANAGSDQSGVSSPVTLAANNPANGTGAWTIISGDGNGLLGNPADPASGFSGTGGESYTLRWTISNACGSEQDDVTIGIASPCAAFVDARDGQTYGAVQIGDQCWMSQNLNVMHSTGNSWCYNSSSTNCDTYGRLYSWTATMNGSASSDANPSGVQGICPSGWHVPSDSEWKELEIGLGMSPTDADLNNAFRGTDQGSKLKQAGTSLWSSPNTGTNSTGFNGLPGGLNQTIPGTAFAQINSRGWFNTSTRVDAGNVWIRFFQNDQGGVYRVSMIDDRSGSVRCVKN